MKKKENQSECPYLSIKEFAKKYPTFSESTLRWFIYTNEGNFNEFVVKRVASRIYISVLDFWKWIELQDKINRSKSERKKNE